MSYQPLTYSDLLEIAEKETAQLQRAADEANKAYCEHSDMGHRVSVRDMVSFTARKKALFVATVYAEADLRRSQAREAILKKEIRDSSVRGQKIAA